MYQPPSDFRTDTHTHADNTAWWVRNPLTAASFGGLILLLLAVVFWLPHLVASSSTSTASSSTPVTPSSPVPASPIAAHPIIDKTAVQPALPAPDQTQARTAIQELLPQLQEKQQTLEALHVKQWGAVAYSTAQTNKTQADSLYNQRQFDQALALYSNSLQQLNQLLAQADTIFTQALATGNQALNDNQTIAAQTAFTLAVAMHPDNTAATQGLQRAHVMDQVTALLNEADALQKQQQWPQAKSKIEAALALDPLSNAAQQQLSALQNTLRDDRYSQLMGEGYSQLLNKKFSKAQTLFKQALQQKPGDKTASQALADATNHLIQQQVTEHMANALNAEQQEHWAAAAQYYEQALRLDKSLADARIGQLRSSARATLDHNLTQTLANPQRLQDDNVYNQANSYLVDAQAITQPGSHLQQQISQLSVVLQQSQQPINVQLQSNNATDVVIYRVGKLGNFRQHTTSLKPGHYTLVGSRKGYRDVRQEITVSAQGMTQPIIIQCDEKIAR